MRIFNEDKTMELLEYDLTRGYLKEDKLLIARHEAVEGRDEAGHYETVAEYENGGRDVAWVVDTPAVDACEAYDEYEDIQIYVEYTAPELAQIETAELKRKLSETDYQAIKYAEGALSAEEYEGMRTQRAEWRRRIGELENTIGKGEDGNDK